MSKRHGWHKCPTLPRAAWRRLHCACRRHGRHLCVNHEVEVDGRHLDFDVEDVVDWSAMFTAWSFQGKVFTNIYDLG